MAPNASSSSAITPTYDVFISFRGEDTRYGFVSHLYTALDRKKIRTYIDDKRLERGCEISYSLTQSIQESKVSIIVFSENYASSSWCLDELVHILHCKERYCQIVIPVFYHVEPAHIRKLQESFGKAFSVLEERFSDRDEKVKMWRTALARTSDLSGWDSSVIRSEAELVDKIVQDVIRKLDRMSQSPSDYLKGLVGIKKRMKKIESLLRMITHDVRIIGIWGMVGIGKTTLARVVFGQLSSPFEGHCFLANVREEWGKGRKDDLQKELFSKLLEEDNPYNVWSRLSNKKVLIVLDDVNDEEQLEYLIGDFSSLFGRGSRIIVTTRDRQILRRYVGADDEAIYKVEELNNHEARELLDLSAPKGIVSATGFIEMSKWVVDYAKGIPLCLKVLGNFLIHFKENQNWESGLNDLEDALDNKIQNLLKVSYDGLQEKDQQTFLAIASFFNGEDRDFVEEFWSACGFSAKAILDNLCDKSLLFITDSNRLQMNDLVQKMGRKIVLCTKELEKRSWLWSASDVVHVLRKNTGTGQIQGISLDTNSTDVFEKLDLDPVVFEKMQNLVFLKIVDGEPHKLHYFSQDIWSLPPALRYLGQKGFENMHNLGFNRSADEVSHKLHFPQDIKSLPTTLRYLEWWNYPSKSLPTNFVPQNIVELKMPHNKLKKLWSGVQNLGNLRHIDLSFSYRLSQIPDLSCAPKLESIILVSCWSLNSVPPLKFLIVDEHTRSAEPWNFKHGTLNFDGCSGLKSLPNITGNIKYIKLCSTAVKKLPSSISSLENLISLDLSNCELKNLPNIKYLYRLNELRISDCKNLQSLPELPLSLRLLDACECTSLKTVSNSISRQVEGCRNDYQVTPDMEFLFGNCSKLDQNARIQIMIQSQIRILRTATISVPQSEEMSHVFCGKPSVSCCFPGDEIPFWFSNQEERSLITIKLPPNWHNNNFLGFALCVVSKFSYPTSLASSRFSSMLTPLKRVYTEYHFEVKCEISFRSNRGETSPRFLCPFQDESSGRRRSFVRCLSSNHVFMWYKYEDYHEYLDATEVSFEFQVLFNKRGVSYCCDDYIRRCGICFLYLQDVKNLASLTMPKQMDIFDKNEAHYTEKEIYENERGRTE